MSEDADGSTPGSLVTAGRPESPVPVAGTDHVSLVGSTLEAVLEDLSVECNDPQTLPSGRAISAAEIGIVAPTNTRADEYANTTPDSQTHSHR